MKLRVETTADDATIFLEGDDGMIAATLIGRGIVQPQHVEIVAHHIRNLVGVLEDRKTGTPRLGARMRVRGSDREGVVVSLRKDDAHARLEWPSDAPFPLSWHPFAELEYAP